MAMETANGDRREQHDGDSGREHEFFVGLARAVAGALIFALPMLMTMEMWWIGFYIEPWKLILLLALQIPLLVGLSLFSGFKRSETLRDDVADAFVAFAVATATATLVLFLFDVIDVTMPAREVIGKVALQSFPASIGAMLARDQLSGAQGRQAKQRKQHPSYPGALFLMGIGALFLGLNVAPTEEMVLLSYMMNPWREIALALLSLVAMHAFVYAVHFRGTPEPDASATFWGLFLRFTVVGYALVLLISLYVLWTFGRTDGTSIEEILSACVVLGFPGAIGAAAARLIL